MFCIVCEKKVQIKEKITSHIPFRYKGYNRIYYERHVCTICGSELLIKEGNYVNDNGEGN